MPATPPDSLKTISNHSQHIRKPSRFHAESRSEDARAATRYIILIRRTLRPRRVGTKVFLLCYQSRARVWQPPATSRMGLKLGLHLPEGIEVGLCISCDRPPGGVKWPGAPPGVAKQGSRTGRGRSQSRSAQSEDPEAHVLAP